MKHYIECSELQFKSVALVGSTKSIKLLSFVEASKLIEQNSLTETVELIDGVNILRWYFPTVVFTKP